MPGRRRERSRRWDPAMKRLFKLLVLGFFVVLALAIGAGFW
jgi:hypothetical protein